jgi:hypothetical protein
METCPNCRHCNQFNPFQPAPQKQEEKTPPANVASPFVSPTLPAPSPSAPPPPAAAPIHSVAEPEKNVSNQEWVVEPPKVPQEKLAEIPSDEFVPEVIDVQLTINVGLAAKKWWTKKQKEDMAMYIALYSSKYTKGFQKFEWAGMGAFLCEPLKVERDQEIVVDVTALDSQMRFSTDRYNKQKFIDTFGGEALKSLPLGWPKNEDCTSTVDGSTKNDILDFRKLAIQEPKLIEI